MTAHEIDPDQRMRQVLAEMETISEAGAAQLGDLIHGGEPNRAPKGPKVSLAEEHRRAYMDANGPTSRCAALQAAEDALINARHAPRRELVSGTLEWRVAIGDDPRPVRTVAIVYGVTEAHVYKMRAWVRRSRNRV